MGKTKMSRMITQSTLTLEGVDLKTPALLEPPPRVTVGEPPARLTVACVWWGKQKGNQVTPYGVEYVEKLRNSVARSLTIPHDFVCITNLDVPDGVIKVEPPLPQTTGGWWQKVGLFTPGLFDYSQRVMFLDLDVVITGSLDNIASVQEPFCMIENYGPNKRHAAHNSSCLVWTPSKQTENIYTKFSDDVMKELHGDQCWIWRVRRNEIWDYPKSWVVSYKYEKHPQWKHANKDTAIVVFHGDPKPHQVRDAGIVQHWR